MSNKNLKLIITDSLVCVAAIYLAFILRFEFSIPKEFLGVFYKWVPFLYFQVGVFYFSGLYARIWRYTSLFDLYAILSAVLTAGCFSIIYVVLTMGSIFGYPRSVLLLYLILNGIATVSVRLCVRVYFSHYHTDSVLKNQALKKIGIGAGRTGEKIAREIMTTLRHQYTIIAGFVDDNIGKTWSSSSW